MITVSIDVTKIDKQKLYVGKKGTYLNAVLIETPNSEYGDYMVKENISKEDRERGIEGAILGNGKIVKKSESKQNQEPTPPPGEDDLPF